VAFREVIEAVLKVKDANRFKAGMDKAARSVRKLGHDEEEAAAQGELLKEINKKLERQSIELTAAVTLLAHSIDELGDEMLQTAAKGEVMTKVINKASGASTPFFRRWSFWKDRLSLTRSEIMTTALTIGTYFAPAIVALGSSFAYAAIGGGAVAGAGLATFITGMVSLALVIQPAINNIKKIQKAQDMYNQTVSQYGAASVEASRQSAHLYAVIEQNGGKPVYEGAAANHEAAPGVDQDVVLRSRCVLPGTRRWSEGIEDPHADVRIERSSDDGGAAIGVGSVLADSTVEPDSPDLPLDVRDLRPSYRSRSQGRCKYLRCLLQGRARLPALGRACG
jgi:hypothetical protein